MTMLSSSTEVIELNQIAGKFPEEQEDRHYSSPENRFSPSLSIVANIYATSEVEI